MNRSGRANSELKDSAEADDLSAAPAPSARKVSQTILGKVAERAAGDYSNLIHISTAEIVCFVFPTPIACNQSSSAFVQELYSARSECVDGSLTFALARGRTTVEKLMGATLDQLMPQSAGFDTMFAQWHEQSLTTRCFEFTRCLAPAAPAVFHCVIYGRIDQERLSRIWIVARDVTNHIRAVDALARAEIHYRALLERPGVTFARISRDGYYEHLTPSFAESLGLKTEDISSRRVKLCDYIHPDDAPIIETLLSHQEGRLKTPLCDVQLRFRNRDGTYRWFSVRQRPLLSASGKVENIDLVAVDLTTTKSLEQELERLQPLATAAESAAAVSHDIRNQLTAAIGNLELALDASNGNLPQEVAATLQACKSSLSTALELSSDYTTRAQPERTDMTASCNLFFVVHEAQTIFRRQLPLSAELVVEDIPAVEVSISRAQLQNILLNLLINARDALPPLGGCITIRGSSADDSANCGASVAITISDNGCGIPPELLSRVFDPYVTTKQSSGGTGLGLASVRSNLTRIGGEIYLSSVAGSGTSCKIRLPLSSAEHSQHAASDTPKHLVLTQPLSMLIAEDEPAIRSVLETALQSRGHTVFSVADGAALLDYVRDPARSFDIILVDEAMPKSSGQALLLKIRSLRPTTPLIITSGNHAIAHALNTLGPRTRFLAKPFDLAQLHQTISLAYQSPH